MLAKIRHIAMYTHNHAAVDKFYKTVFGMRRMTSNTLDETGKQNTERATSATALSVWRSCPVTPACNPASIISDSKSMISRNTCGAWNSIIRKP